jgi:HEAT repeat protein
MRNLQYLPMSRKQGAIAIAASVLVIGALAYAILPDNPLEPEPCYNNTRLSEWLAVYHAPIAPGGAPSPAEIAVRSIGTNALPFLLEWIRYELPSSRQALLKLATWPVEGKPLEEGKIVYGQSLIQGKALPRAERAICGFAILNANAVSAIPELETLMKNNKKPAAALRAIWALGEIGGPTFPALTNALADPNQPHRVEIIESIYALELQSPYYYGDTYKGACLPALIRTLNDPDEWVRRQARATLFNLALHGLAPSTYANSSAP